MKSLKHITTVLLFFIAISVTAQQGINYKALIKDGGGNVVASQNVDIQFIIYEGVALTNNVYQETHASVMTDANGIVIVNIGEGTTSDVFANIDWGSDDHYLNVQIDTGGGLTDMGTTSFKMVPYALHAKTAESVGSCGLSIGDTYQGGIIFYLDPSGCHGLIAAPSDQSTGIQWYNGSFVDTYAYGNGIGNGEGNSQGIRRSQGTCSSCYASELCQDLDLGGPQDWYLPSKYELNLMYKNIGQGNSLGLGNVGGFADFFYWSSTEYNNTSVWLQDFDDGYQSIDDKNLTHYVRAVRVF